MAACCPHWDVAGLTVERETETPTEFNGGPVAARAPRCFHCPCGFEPRGTDARDTGEVPMVPVPRHVLRVLSMIVLCFSSMASGALSSAFSASASAAPDTPRLISPVTDLGQTSPGQTVTASLVLKVRHPDDLERTVAATEDPTGGSHGSYHRFWSLADFVANQAPADSD